MHQAQAVETPQFEGQALVQIVCRYYAKYTVSALINPHLIVNWLLSPRLQQNDSVWLVLRPKRMGISTRSRMHCTCGIIWGMMRGRNAESRRSAYALRDGDWARTGLYGVVVGVGVGLLVNFPEEGD